MLSSIIKIITRKKTPIIFDNYLRNKPISSVFGFDRGTPIDRYYIEKFLADNSRYIKGKTLEIADSHYSKQFGKDKVESFEVLHATVGNENATIIGDLSEISTLPCNYIDCFICTQTFNFIFDVQKAIEGAYYLLKPEGTLLATVAGISQISQYDMERWGDYWRFTKASVQKLFEPIFVGGKVDIITYGNVLSSSAFLQGISVEDLPDVSLLDYNDKNYQMIIGIVAKKGGI